jgi:hypothetical protein
LTLLLAALFAHGFAHGLAHADAPVDGGVPPPDAAPPGHTAPAPNAALPGNTTPPGPTPLPDDATSAPDADAPSDAALPRSSEPLERAPPGPPLVGELRGRVWARGSITPLAGAVVTTAEGTSAIADADGRFTLRLPAGPVDLVVSAADYEPLRVRESLLAGQGLAVDYRLLPLPEHRRYESNVRGTARHEGARFQLQGEALRTLPASLGDPFRTIGLMPGVSQPITLLPLYVIRGDSPSMNGFFLDGMRLPQLFHLLVGGGVVHPRFVDRLEFYPGSYDASLGRYAGGIIDSETRGASPTGTHGEAQIRFFDVSAALETALPHDLRVTVSGSYGWPGQLVRLFSPGTDVEYADYQLRADWHGLTLQALGSYDSLKLADSSGKGDPSEFRLTFHRLQLRHRARRGRLRYEAALVGGYDQMLALSGDAIEKLALTARANLSVRWSRITVSAGADVEGSRFRGSPGARANGAGTDALGELAGNRDGVVAGAWALAALDLVPRRFTATLSARFDVYHAADVSLFAIDPRLNLRAQLTSRIALFAGGGVYHQPPAFPVPLPGIDTFALRLGLQTAYHSSVGAEVELPYGFSASLTAYYQAFRNIDDTTLNFDDPSFCSAEPSPVLSGLAAQYIRPVDGQAYGGELLVRRTRGVVTGWLAYTVGRSERFLPCGNRPADFDQTHVLNLVVQARLPRNFMLGGHINVASGRPGTARDDSSTQMSLRNNWRMPPYVQVDLRLDREWLFRRWALSVFLEVVNLTYSQSAFGINYAYDAQTGGPDYSHPLVQGFNWVLPSLGARGRF